MAQTFFITGIGTGIGKTVVSAVLTEALKANYWKPVQAGYENGTDTEWVQSVVENNQSVFFPEVYKLKLPASPHLAARQENTVISIDKIKEVYDKYSSGQTNLIIEGAGGLLVPLNEKETVADLIAALNASVILVSRHYLGSINHSLLTAAVCRQRQLQVTGWIFNDQFMDYEDDIVKWSGYKRLASMGKLFDIDKHTISRQAAAIREELSKNLLL